MKRFLLLLVFSLILCGTGRAQETLFSVVSDQIYISRDGGQSWVGIYVNSSGAIHYNDLCFDETTKCIYGASTLGLVRSTDGGQSWKLLYPSGEAGPVNRIAVSMEGDGSLYALTMDGLYLSKNSGQSWQSLALPRKDCFFLTAFGKSRKLYLAGGNRIYASADNGNTWQSVSAGLPENMAILDMSVNPANSSHIYLATTEGLWASGDGGKYWKNKTISPKGWIQTIKIQRCKSMPQVMYVLDEDVKESGVCYLRRSTDGGQSWKTIASKDTIKCFASHPLNPSVIYMNWANPLAVAGVDQSFATVSKSSDAGKTWTELESIMPGYTGIKNFMIRPW